MKHQRKLFIITLFLSLSAFCLFIYIANSEQATAYILTDNVSVPSIILDAGHGGEDGGAVASDGTLEKNLNLSIALQTQQLLQLIGIPCVMTRTQDEDLANHSLTTIRKRKMSDINARMSMLENNPESIYVGIHQNFYESQSVHGLQVFYSENHQQSKLIADSIQLNTKVLLQKENNRKTKPAGDNIYLLYHTNNPAVMVECGFISNPTELEKLKTTTYGTQLAICIVGGILNYYENKGVS